MKVEHQFDGHVHIFHALVGKRSRVFDQTGLEFACFFTVEGIWRQEWGQGGFWVGHEDLFDAHCVVHTSLCWMEIHENVTGSFCLLFGNPDVNCSSLGFI